MNKEELRKFIKEVVNECLINEEKEVEEQEWKLLNELMLDLNNIYNIDEKNSTKLLKQFMDDEGRINIIKARNEKDGWMEIKFYWLKEKNGILTPTYENPIDSTSKTFNTYLSLFLNHFIKLNDKIILKPTDDIRQRLYRISLNKFLNKNEYQVFERDKLIYIIKK